MLKIQHSVYNTFFSLSHVGLLQLYLRDLLLKRINMQSMIDTPALPASKAGVPPRLRRLRA